MAEIKIHCGGWYIDNSTLKFNENKVLSVVGGGSAGPQGPAGPSKQGVAVPDVSGSEAANAITTINALLASLRDASLIASD